MILQFLKVNKYASFIAMNDACTKCQTMCLFTAWISARNV